MNKDWRKAQNGNYDIFFIVDDLIEGHKPTSSEAEAHNLDKKYIADWTKCHLKDYVLLKTINISDEEFKLYLLHSLGDDIFHAYHTDLAHQGRN